MDEDRKEQTGRNESIGQGQLGNLGKRLVLNTFAKTAPLIASTASWIWIPIVITIVVVFVLTFFIAGSVGAPEEIQPNPTPAP